MSEKLIAAQGYRLRRAEADAKGAKRWKRRALDAEAETIRLRARIAELEGRAESLIREHLEHEKEINETWHNRLIEEAALKLNERARAEAAEANSKRRHELLVDVARAINALGEELVAIPGLVAKVRAERDRLTTCLLKTNANMEEAERDLYLKLQAVEAERDEAKEWLRQTIEKVADQRLDGYRALGQRAAEAENQLDAIRAERDRYLAAIVEIGNDRAFIRGGWDTRFCEVRIGIETWQALRRIAEEAK